MWKIPQVVKRGTLQSHIVLLMRLYLRLSWILLSHQMVSIFSDAVRVGSLGTCKITAYAMKTKSLFCIFKDYYFPE